MIQDNGLNPNPWWLPERLTVDQVSARLARLIEHCYRARRLAPAAEEQGWDDRIARITADVMSIQLAKEKK